MDGGISSFGHLGLHLGETMSFRVRGECMRGLHDGEQVTIRKRRFYLPGDMVVVRRRDHWNVHRLLGYALGPQGYVVLTQADSATQADPASQASVIEGSTVYPVSAAERWIALRRYAQAIWLRARRST
jgi:hypothetical protein